MENQTSLTLNNSVNISQCKQEEQQGTKYQQGKDGKSKNGLQTNAEIYYIVVDDDTQAVGHSCGEST